MIVPLLAWPKFMSKGMTPNVLRRMFKKCGLNKGPFDASDSVESQNSIVCRCFLIDRHLHGTFGNYTLGDVIARFQGCEGKKCHSSNGLGRVQASCGECRDQNGIPPSDWTRSNINYMREQMKRLGFSFDWSREFATCDSEYYRWEQWLFLKLLEKGVAYRKTATVNWDPVDQAVLANEQVVDGMGWRSGAPVETRDGSVVHEDH